MAATPDDRIDAEPTKRFFVEMFTKDIALEQAVLDLVDNSIDGARRAQRDGNEPLADYWVKIVMNRSEFRIDDNCGGFDKATARTRAFKFGRESGAVRTPGSIGQFGVGMKRALFKFGKRFKVYSATSDEEWGIVLEGDTRAVTGWGEVADEFSVPRYHGQFARFRGIATFDSDSAERVPWNTTKTDIDTDNPVWRSAREKMMELMRPVIDFLNVLDADIEQHTRERSPMFKELTQTPMVKYETIAMKTDFSVPSIEQLDEVVPYTKIQYSRPIDDVEVLKKSLGLGSAKAVGERTFDNALQRQRGR